MERLKGSLSNIQTLQGSLSGTHSLSGKLSAMSDGEDTSDATLENGNQLLEGVTAYSKGVKYTGTIESKEAETYTPGKTNIIIPSGKYLSGDQTIVGDQHLYPQNIRKGISIFGVTGTYNPVTWEYVTSKTYTLNNDTSSNTLLDRLSIPLINWNNAYLLYVRIRGGARSKSFIGSDTFFVNEKAANGISDAGQLTDGIRCAYRSNYGIIEKSVTYGVSGDGVYARQLTKYSNSLIVEIYKNYSSTRSYMIDGLYECDVYRIANYNGTPFLV